MSNIGREIHYLVGRKRELWPNKQEMKISDTAKLLRQVYPDKLQIDSEASNQNQEQPTDANNQVYLDLGPATRSLICITDPERQEKTLREHAYLQRLEHILYSVTKQNRTECFYEIGGLIDWHKSIELDVIEDELLLSIP